MLLDQRSIFKWKMLAKSLRHAQAINVPIVNQGSLILFKIILFYLKPMYNWATFYSPHFCCMFHQFMMDLAITNKTWMVSCLWKRVDSARQCSAGYGRAGLTSASQDFHTLQYHRRGWQFEILKFRVLALTKMSTYCVSWHPKNAWCIIRRKSAR